MKTIKKYKGFTITIYGDKGEYRFVVKRLDGSVLLDSGGDTCADVKDAEQEAKYEINTFLIGDGKKSPIVEITTPWKNIKTYRVTIRDPFSPDTFTGDFRAETKADAADNAREFYSFELGTTVDYIEVLTVLEITPDSHG